MKIMKPFKEPIYVTRPLLPDLTKVQEKLKEIWDSKWLTNCGPQHRLLEEKLQERLQVPCLSLFNNGTIALMVACQSLRLSGDVITTPFTFAATPHILSWNNIKPIFCDIDEASLNIDAEKIESMITPQTTAILAVHVFGTPCDVNKIQQVADKYGLKVIYDAAHAFGVKVDGKGIGIFGDISMMSFHSTKLYHTIEGGALMHSNSQLKERIDLLKNFGIKNEEEVVMPGINGKMNEVQAAIGIINLEYVEKEREKRKKLIDIYRQELEQVKGVILPKVFENVTSNYQYFVIRIQEDVFGHSRNWVYNELKKYNVFARKYFYPLCSEYICYRQLFSSQKDNLPIANRIADEVLSMPLYGELPSENVIKICNLIKSFRK